MGYQHGTCGSGLLRSACPSYQSLGVVIYCTKAWKVAIIHPVAKVPLPATPSDFRPISVTPILCRLTEREIVRRYTYPAFEDNATSNLLKDQYAFRPTGSTTSALISIQQQTTQMLEDNEYVAILSHLILQRPSKRCV